MRFGDVVMAVASLAVILALILFPIQVALVPALGFYWGFNASAIVSVFLSALIAGCIFARKVWEEARMEAIAKITVLGVVLVIFIVIMQNAALADWTPWVKDNNPPNQLIKRFQQT